MRFCIGPENQLTTNNGLPSEAQEKTNLYKLKKITFFKINGYFLQSRKKQVHKEYPPVGPCVCNHKLELPFAIKNTFCLTASPVRFSSFLIFVLNCGLMVLNQNPIKIPSEPIRKEMICQSLIRSLRGKSTYNCEANHLPKKWRRGAFYYCLYNNTSQQQKDYRCPVLPTYSLPLL